MGIDVSTYYSKPLVAREVSDYLQGRWVAVHCERRMRDGRPVIIRYYKGQPLVVRQPSDVAKIIRRFAKLKPRAFYGTANIYRKLETREDALDYTGNVVLKTPTWDVDSKPEWWRATIEVGRAIVDVLEREGIVDGVWLKWSGRGLHVHIHEKSFSQDVYARYGALNVSWAVVEYTLRKASTAVSAINSRWGIKIKTENLMDPQRVFTAPLSLHRELDVACVAFKPDEIDDFDPSWLDPKNPRHNTDWRKYVEGEGDELAEKAIHLVGYYPRLIGRKKRKVGLDIPDIHKFAPAEPKGLDKLRLNLTPEPHRRIEGSYEEAVRLLEDYLSMYALGLWDLETTIANIKATRDVTIRGQGFSRGKLEKLEALYTTAIEKLLELRKPEDVKKWLLAHGPPRGKKTMDEYI